MPILAQVLQRERLTKQQTEKRVFWSRVRSFRVRLHRSGETAAPVTSRPGYTSWLPQKFRRITTRHHGNVQEMLPDLYLTGVEWNRSSHVSEQTSRLSELPRARAADFRGRADRRDLANGGRTLRASLAHSGCDGIAVAGRGVVGRGDPVRVPGPPKRRHPGVPALRRSVRHGAGIASSVLRLRFLIDNARPPRVAELPVSAGHYAAHVSEPGNDLGLPACLYDYTQRKVAPDRDQRSDETSGSMQERTGSPLLQQIPIFSFS